MSATDPATSTPEGDPPEGGDGGGLRRQLEDALAENKTLKGQIRKRAYDDAGIPDGARDLFDTAYTGELTVEALREFGAAKGFALKDLTPSQPGTPGAPAPATPGQELSEGEQRLADLAGSALPPGDPSIDDRIAKAEADGDWATFDRLSAEKLAKARA